MKSTFDNLSEKKKQRVINACIEEFSEHGYELGSMDGIIKRAEISKGGLYQYVSLYSENLRPQKLETQKLKTISFSYTHHTIVQTYHNV